MIGEIETCKFKIVETPEGKHLESDCLTKEAARELADLLEHEVVIRVKPAGSSTSRSPVELTKDDLVKQRQPEKTTFTCNKCGATLEASENPCHKCEARLDWDRIQKLTSA
jgi:tRNA(Ile2) C34 agmatinyltransferase TiaS